MVSKEEAYKRARKIVKKRKDYQNSLTAFCIIVPFLFFINIYSTGLRPPWFLFAAAGWGIGLLFARNEINQLRKEGKWEDEEVERELERMGYDRKSLPSGKDSEGLELRKDRLELKELEKRYDENDFV